ncbi:MAG TPA: protein kinase [Terriglobia bacterium]|nr:protein kinase [Terriglobia bacterium]
MSMIGRTLSHYKITAALGAGGMGEVYRATDTKLGRDVALKVLPEAFARDAERMARFQREAQVLASLNHPNIASIYGIEESGSTRALVMELVEGQTLAERIAGTRPLTRPSSGAPPSPQDRGSGGEGARPLPPDEVLPIARQIAEALEAAHEKGVIHRDLKPANVKITPDGAVKVLDFGLAKALDPDASRINISNSPTLTAAATQAGMIMGTAAYMSPEQAKGKGVDRRGDIWAFGCVLYEMLVGKKAFAGETVSETLAAVIKDEPDWSPWPDAIPPPVRELARRCLIKDPKRRLRDIGEARITLDEVMSGNAPTTASPNVVIPPAPQKPGPARHGITLGLAVLALVSTGVAIWSLLHTPPIPSPPVARLAITILDADKLALGLTPAITLSPDGRRLVYSADHGGTNQLFVRPLDSLEATPIPGTEGAESPFFSPDGLSLGFFAGGKMKRVSLSGGAPLTICNAAADRGATWLPDDTIIFSPAFTSPLFRVPAAGGTPKQVTTLDRKKGEISHRWPQILPGGKALLFTTWFGGNFDDAQISLIVLDTGQQKVVLTGGTNARYLPPGYVVYARADGLSAAPFSLSQLAATGPSVSVIQGVTIHPTTGGSEFSTSDNGSLAYIAGGMATNQGKNLYWVDRKGVARQIPAPPRGYANPRISPSGEEVVVGTTDNNQGVWIYDLRRGSLTKIDEAALMPLPIWTRDGKSVTFNAAFQGPANLFGIAADGSGSRQRMAASDNQQYPACWSPDGQTLAFSELDPTTGYDIWLLKPAGGGKPRPFLQTPANEGGAEFSPDGHWLAYTSDESGRNEVYVSAFPGPGARVQVSTDGGREVMWARNGRELFYRNGDQMMAVSIQIKAGLVASKPAVLFKGNFEPGLYASSADYDVSPDGQRFLMVGSGEKDTVPTQVNMVLNWSEELRRLAPKGKK